MKVGLVGCVKSKQNTASTAEELYTSPLFTGRRRWVEESCDRWFILSAKHGLLEPTDFIEPYDVTLTDLTAADRRRWSAGVVLALERALGQLGHLTFEIHAGAAYANYGLARGLAQVGASVSRPAAGLGLGQQLQFYNRPAHVRDTPTPPPHRQSPPTATVSRTHSSTSARGKYTPLTTFLKVGSGPITIRFSQVDELVGGLPESAFKWRPWWANDASHSQARGWMDAGRRTTSVDMERGVVTFV